MTKLYYWNKKPNFGDTLTPLLLYRFTKLPSQWAPPEEAQLIMVGSILEHMSSSYKGVIAGCGKLHEKSILSFPDAKILALRGPLSARGIKGDYILADPALLADELVPKEDKMYNLGIVAHWTDKTLPLRQEFLKYNPRIIDVSQHPLHVISEIGRCKKIVASSLHGIILADAFGIPRRTELAPKMITHPQQEGGIFKWMDYNTSIGMEFKTGVTQEADRHRVTEKQHELFDVFEHIKSLFRSDEAIN